MGPASTGETSGLAWWRRMQREKKVKIPEHDRVLLERYLVAFSSTAPKGTRA